MRLLPGARSAGVGKVIRYDCDQIYDLIIWITATEERLPLKQAVEAMLGDLELS
jgi:hypothetical protein